jgi:HEAT repeat protein
MLDVQAVSDLLFDCLRDAVETALPQEYIKRLVYVLGRFGELVIPQAVKLSQPGPTNNVYVRIEALYVLAGTNTIQAVKPLISNLSDADDLILKATVNALVQLGPTLVLDTVLEELKSPPSRVLVHWAVIAVLQGFLSQHTLNDTQYQHILEALLQAISSLYMPDIQEQASSLLLQEATQKARQQDERWQRVVELVVHSLDDRDKTKTANLKELLQRIGAIATPLLLDELQKSQVETVKANIVAVLGAVRDPDALLPLLPFLDDHSPLVRKQASIALCSYAPESIPPLIKMVLHHQKQSVAESASAILKEIGSACVPPVVEGLERIVRNRTLLLVGVLVAIHDTRAVRPLLDLLKRLLSETDVPLTVAVIQALGTFPEKQVVPPLLEILASGISPFFEEASRVLSSFGEIALPELLATLDVQEETASIREVRATLRKMQPFLDKQLLEALSNCSEAQARQIELVFLEKDDTAPFLVSNISHTDQRVRTFVLALLDKMEAEQIIPPLLDALKNSGELDIIARFLLKYPESMLDLVMKLSDPQRDDAAATILLRFGIVVIPYLEPALDNSNAEVRKHAYSILMQLAHNEHALRHKEITELNAIVSQQRKMIAALEQELTRLNFNP